MARQYLVLAFLLVAASPAPAPAPDLAGMAATGHMPSFEQLLDARFDPAGTARFDAFEQWAKKATPEEQEQWRGAPCAHAESRGLAEAMAIAARRSSDRASAEALWSEVDAAYTTLLASVAKAEKAASEAGKNRPTPLGRELARRVAIDQAWRGGIFGTKRDELVIEVLGFRTWPNLCRVDTENTAFLKAAVTMNGWPTISRHGKDAAGDAWLLAQHADADPDFQEQILARIAPLVPFHEVRPQDYALLFDRVALARGRPQRYGTQFGEGKGGCMAARPVENPSKVDALRKKVGLDSLADYSKRLEEAYHRKPCADLFDTAEMLPNSK